MEVQSATVVRSCGPAGRHAAPAHAGQRPRGPARLIREPARVPVGSSPPRARRPLPLWCLPHRHGSGWRAASGFAHGRYWLNLKASQPYAAFPADNGIHTLALVIDEDQHRPLAQYCNSILRRLQEHYTARVQAH
ncbi:hypothetical protein [Streptomyces sp. NPDC059468]|uniref:hypothetical protein n=1 Tax=Streptomyces sp. NPDC059468 TaxID=3346845 RepID=UPI0036A4244D